MAEDLYAVLETILMKCNQPSIVKLKGEFASAEFEESAAVRLAAEKICYDEQGRKIFIRSSG